MAAAFRSIKPEEIKDNPFQAIGQEWMLLAAGQRGSYNMMTASWGAWGVLWHRPAVFCVVRPGRYTYGFMESSGYFTLNFFDKRYKKALDFCGVKSGRDVDKAASTGLAPVFDKGSGAVYFEQARLVIVARKIYSQDIDPARFLDSSINKNYPQKDYHRMYVGEVARCLVAAGRARRAS